MSNYNDFFDTGKLLVRNISSVLSKVENPDNELLKESLSLLLKITESQLDINKVLVSNSYGNGVIVNTIVDKILVNMLCVINMKDGKKTGKIIHIDIEQNIYKIKILGEEKVISVSRDKFNI